MPFRWRPDGDWVRDVLSTRRIMPVIMRRRNESIVYFEQKVDTSKTWEFLQAFRETTGLPATLLHLLIWASGQILKDRPPLNRFVARGRIFQLRSIWIGFSTVLQRRKLTLHARSQMLKCLSTVKRSKTRQPLMFQGTEIFRFSAIKTDTKSLLK